MLRFVRDVFVGVFVLAAALAGAVGWFLHEFDKAGPLGEPKTIIIPRYSGVDNIADRLARQKVLDNPLIFEIGARVMTQSRGLRAGEYVFPAGISARGVVELLQSGKTVIRRLTVPEGLTNVQIANLLRQTDGLEGVVPKDLLDPAREGTLLPETYFFSWGDARADMLKRMARAQETLLAELWDKRAPGLALASPREAVVLASIVEKETGKEEERPRIAGVFHNRLKRGMMLQSDPTVIYSIVGGDATLGRPISVADLRHQSPYNTYVTKGLPPGPIANPGRAAIAATLSPQATDELFFVADGTGGHAFARTEQEHSRNVARWREIERRQQQPTPPSAPSTPAPSTPAPAPPPARPTAPR